MRKIFVLLSLVASVSLFAASFPLTRDGRPAAEIVIGSSAPAPVANSAQELQRWVEAISGAKLAVVETGSGQLPQVVLSCDPAVLAQFPADAAALKGNDGYALRQKDNRLYMLATVPHGVVNAVFRSLYRSTDIIWAFPDDETGTFFSRQKDVALQTGYLDIPRFSQRGWQLGGGLPHEFMWIVRQANNWSTHSASGVNRLNDEWDMIKESLGGHNLNTVFISEKKYYDTRPDFFPLINGKRVRPSDKTHRTQLCFTNRDMITAFKVEFDARVKQYPTASIYRVMIEDNKDQCQCEACQADIALPDGTTLSKDDPRFYSTRFFIFLNEIAAHTKQHYPGKDLLCFAYFFTEIPPAVKVDPIIRVQFCPIYKNSKFAVTDPGNLPTFEKFDAWLQNTTNLTWREYYGLVVDFPRPIDNIAAADFRYCLERGVNRHFSEMENYNFNREQRGYGRGPASWDCNAMYFWVLANLQWDPYQDVKAMRRDFLQRVFRNAAPDVEKYYALLEEGWQKGDSRSVWSTQARPQWMEAINMDRQLVQTLESCLASAAAKISDPKAADLLRRIRISFDMYKNLGQQDPIRIPRCAGEPPFDPNFASAPWQNALTITDFFLQDNDNTPYKEQPLLLKFLHDGENVYVGFKSTNPGIVQKVNPEFRNAQLEALQLYFELTPDKVTDVSRGRYNATAISLTNATEVAHYVTPMKITHKVQETPDGWSLWAKIAIKDTGFDPADKKLRGLYCFRYWTGKNKVQWFDGFAGPPNAIYHSPPCFADIILE